MVLRRSLLLLIALLLPIIAFATTKYVVTKGDNLYDLSRKFGVSVKDIKTANKLSNNNLGIGNELLIPESNLKRNNRYVVKSGDTISQIAEKFGVKTKDLKDSNKLKNDKLKIGQVLTIANRDINTVPLVQKKPTQTITTNYEYIVKKGDTLSEIADKHGIRTNDLKRVNKLKSHNIQIGQKLVIPNPAVEIKIASHNKEVVPTKTKVEKPSQNIFQNNINSNLTVSNVYKVQKGDTVYGLSNKFKISSENFKKWNNLNNNNLRIGQKLFLTPNKEIKTASNKSDKKSKPNYSGDYTVKKGDTLGHVAVKFGISVKDLKNANDFTNNNLSIGKVLNVPASTNKNKATAKKSNTKPKKITRHSMTKYIVKNGDTLGHVAVKFGISVKDLKNANDFTNNNLSIGKVLNVPASTNKNKATAKKSNTKPKKITRHSMTKYIVKNGDTLGGISSRHGVSVAKIKEASSLKNDKINVGDVLLIPGVQEKSTSSKYTVVTGDTLGRIGNKFGVSVKELKDTNNLTKNDLYVGMKLVVPSNSKITSTHTQSAQKPVQKKSTKYVVKRGDTLGLIAKRYGVSVGSLKTANNMRGNGIKAGQKITIPGSAEYRIQEKKTAYSSNNNNTKEGIIRMAKQYLGAPYKFGGYSFKTGIDCSGYVKKIFSKFNVELPRTARDIYYNAGIRVLKSQLQTGDLVFFRTYASYPSHVGIYMGNNLFIHASSGARKVAITSLDKKYYRNRYIGAKRIRISTIFESEISRK